MERLDRQLRKIGVVVERGNRMAPHAGPPCFRFAGTSYFDWLAQASMTAELPYRLSNPAEPNYCHDCTPAFKAEMMALKACIYPNVTFETVKELGESDVAGMSRSPEVAPVEYPVYADLTKQRGPK